MALRRLGKSPSSGLVWPRSTSLMPTTLGYNVSTFVVCHFMYVIILYPIYMYMYSSHGSRCEDEGCDAWSDIPHCMSSLCVANIHVAYLLFILYSLDSSFSLASYPGPSQLYIVTLYTEKWEGLGDEVMCVTLT